MRFGVKRQKAASPLNAHLGYWLRFVSNQVSHAFALKLAAHGVTPAEWVVLRQLLDSEGVVQSALAERMGMTRGAISKLADRLAAKRLIGRLPDERDRRTQTLRLTAKGRELVPVLAALADRNDAEFFGHLTQRQRKAVELVLKEIVQRHGFRAVPVD
jgi:DNA-binding MarR family transcriptional regulator